MNSLVRNCFLALSLILITYSSFAQDYPASKFGIRLGGNANSWTNEFPALEFEGQFVFPDDWSVAFGGHGGLYVNIRLSELVALEPGVFYTLKGTGTILNTGGSDIEGNVQSSYLDLPLLLRLYVADGFNIIIGSQFSYHLNSKFDFVVDGSTIIDAEDISDSISEFDFAPVLGLGYEFPNGINLNLTGDLGLLTVDAFDELSTFNRNIKFSVGFNFQ